MNALAIVITMFMVVSNIGVYTGAALNTAVAIGLHINYAIYVDNSLWKYTYIYIIGTLAGGALAGLFAKYIHTQVRKPI